MAFQANVLRVLIASPGDVDERRDEIEEAIYKWNNEYALDLNTILLPMRWEKDIVSDYHEKGSQEVINEQIVYNCDILIGVFWTTLGTATPNNLSGTIEEINIFLAKKKDVILYFVNAPVPFDLHGESISHVKKFKESYREKGITSVYNKNNIINDLYKKVKAYNKKNPLNVKEETEHTPTQVSKTNNEINIGFMIMRDVFMPFELLFLHYSISTGIREFDSERASTLNTEQKLINWLNENSYSHDLLHSYNQVISNFFERGIFVATYHDSYEHIITYKMPLALFDRLRHLPPGPESILKESIQKFALPPF